MSASGKGSEPSLDLRHAVLDGPRMSAADRLACTGGIDDHALMARAGTAVAQAIMQRWSPRATCVLCGPGNNGGDGFVVARVLADAGFSVSVALLVPLAKLRGAARQHAEAWHGPVRALDATGIGEDCQLVVDALFGTGLSRPIGRPAAQALGEAFSRCLPIVSVDIPSGVNGDSGATFGAVQATLTVSFFRKKPGHLLQPGRMLCGEILIADIGIDESVLRALAPDTFENHPALWQRSLPRAQALGHKYLRGHALLLGGYPLTGAGRLAARAAARVGAGLTTICVPEQAFHIYAASLTSIMVHAMAAGATLEPLLADTRFNALLIGPGAGIGAHTRAQTLRFLQTRRAVVIDADALSSFADDPAELDRAIQGPCVMTPHDGEFARLFDTAGDKLERARQAARRSGAVLVLKGSDTVIAAPDGHAIINANAPATLATAGSGDVLAGMILGLLAQGMPAFHAAAAAVWMHGDAASRFGAGLIADDLPDLLPQVLNTLEQTRHGGAF